MQSTDKPLSNIPLKILFASIIGISLLYSTQFVLSAEQFYYVSTPSYVIIPGVLAIVSISVAIKEWKNNSKAKFAMIFFALGVVCWFSAEQIWMILEIVFDEDPFPSIADFFYIIAYPFFIAFLLLYVRPFKQHITKNILVFSIIISFAFLLPALHVLMDYYQGEPTLDVSVALIYPILGSVLLFFALLGIVFFIKGTQTYFWIFVFVGFLIDTVSDTLFLFSAIDENYYDGQLTDLLYLIGYLFYTTAFLYYYKSRSHTKSDMNNMTFEVVGKFAIPLIIGTVIVITSILLLFSYFYDDMFTEDSFLLSLLIGIFVIIAVFAASIFIIIRNIDHFIKQKTNEIQTQKQDLEILLDKKSDEILQSSEFSNIGINLSQIIHDLRNPLTVLRMNLDMIENNAAENPIISQRLQQMKESVHLIDEHMSDVLNYVKKPTLEKSQHGLLELIQKSLKSIVLPKTVTVNLPLNDTKIYCDEMRMILVFINLFTNAIDAINKQGTISINAVQKNNRIVIDFANSGPPISDEIIEQIFEPLFTTKSTGTGLGLSTCKKIIQQHNGKITVKNNPTTFTVELPYK